MYKDIGDWDGFITRGEEGPLFRIIPHNHKLLLFQDLSPVNLPGNGEAAQKVWRDFQSIAATWHLAGEEHQVHYGENFIDPPDFALSAFRAYAWAAKASREDLVRHVDLPYCKADLTYLIKLAIACDAK